MQQSAAKGIASAKEAELANRLASDEPTERFEAMKEIEQLLGESKIKENQYRKVWKALFYGLWVADKMKIQMDTATRAAKMIHVLENASTETVMTWIKACFEIFHREWDKIDYWRTSKFLSLARFCLNEIYAFLQEKKWNGTLVRQFNQVFVEYIMANALDTRSTGLTMHMLQVFVDSLLELSDIPYKVLKALLEPFVELLAHSKDRTVNGKIVEFVFRVFVSNLKEGHFKSFEAQKYAGYLLKKASAKDITEFNRKPLYTVQKEFLHFIAPENPYSVQLDLNDDEELGDEGIDIEITKKSGTESTENTETKKTKKQKKAEKKLAKQLEANVNANATVATTTTTKTEKKKEEKGKLQSKMEQKKSDKEQKTQVKNLNNKKLAQQQEDEEEDDEDWAVEGEENGEWEDVEEEGGDDDDEDMEDFEAELEAVAPSKKGKVAKNNKQQEAKGKADKKGNNLKRGRQPLDEEEAEEDMDELPEDWEEELVDESMMEEFGDEEDGDEAEALTETEYMQLLQQGLLGKLPPYLFQTPKEQRAFFAKKNKEYFSNLEKAKKRPIPHSRKVNFDAGKNIVKEFDKRFKLAEGKGDKSAENPGKGILKKTVIAKSVIQTTTTNKNVNKANKKNNKKNNKKKVKF